MCIFIVIYVLSIFVSKNFITFSLALIGNFFTDLEMWLINQWDHLYKVFFANGLFFAISLFSKLSVDCDSCISFRFWCWSGCKFFRSWFWCGCLYFKFSSSGVEMVLEICFLAVAQIWVYSLLLQLFIIPQNSSIPIYALWQNFFSKRPPGF